MAVPAKELSVLRTVYSTSAEFDPGIANNYRPTIAPPLWKALSKEKASICGRTESRLIKLAKEGARIRRRIQPLLEKGSLSDSDIHLLQIASHSTADLMERHKEVFEEIATHLPCMPMDVRDLSSTLSNEIDDLNRDIEFELFMPNWKTVKIGLVQEKKSLLKMLGKLPQKQSRLQLKKSQL